MAYLIRKATLEDCAGIAKVHVDSWRTTYRGIVSEHYLGNMSYEERENRWKSILAESSEDHILYVATTEQGSIVGFASGGAERSEDSEYDGELYAIYLLKEYQRQGIGKQLVKAIVEELSTTYRMMLIWVLADNPSRYFYESLGGMPVRESTITIANQEHAEVAYGWSDLQVLRTSLR